MRTIFAVIGLVLAVGIFLFYTRPAYDATSASRMAIEEYDRALEKAAELQKLKQTLLSRFNTFDPAQVERLHKLLPDHVDNVRLVLDLDNLALSHGLALESVVIGSESEKELTPAVIGGRASIGEADSLLIRFATQGTYQAFKNFLFDLEKSLRIVDLVSLTLEPTEALQPGASGKTPEPIYRYNIMLRTYWLK